MPRSASYLPRSLRRVSFSSTYGQGVDLDPDCVLYGQIDLVEFYTVPLFGYEVPRRLCRFFLCCS